LRCSAVTRPRKRLQRSLRFIYYRWPARHWVRWF